MKQFIWNHHLCLSNSVSIDKSPDLIQHMAHLKFAWYCLGSNFNQALPYILSWVDPSFLVACLGFIFETLADLWKALDHHQMPYSVACDYHTTLCHNSILCNWKLCRILITKINNLVDQSFIVLGKHYSLNFRPISWCNNSYCYHHGYHRQRYLSTNTLE